MPLYPTILTTTWHTLPPEIRAMHDVADHAQVSGIATVRRGTSFLSRLAASIIGFPKVGTDIPVQVNFTVKDNIETWTRTFNGKSFSSTQYAGQGRYEGLLVERFGLLTFAMELVVRDNQLHLVMRHWAAFGIPLPLGLCVQSDTFEMVKDGKFHFNVKISHRFTGLIVHYTGWLV